MLIELILIRDGGSHITMSDGTPYHFAPSGDDPRHIAYVADPAHQERLLSIRGYRSAHGADLVPAPPGPMMQMDSDNRAAATAAAIAAPPVTVSIPIPQPAVPVTPAVDGNAAWTPPVWDNPAPQAPAPAVDLATISNAELRTLFTEVTGRKPGGRMSREKMIMAVTQAQGAIH